MSVVEEGGGETLTLQEVFEKYKGRWVAMLVTERDRNFQPVRGKVVADDVDRYRLREKIMGLKEVCIFYAGEPDYPLLL
jgi:hypothetical protein